jgi:hypothetical protein
MATRQRLCAYLAGNCVLATMKSTTGFGYQREFISFANAFHLLAHFAWQGLALARAGHH